MRDDPYVLEDRGMQTIDWANWPRVEYPDIYNFLVKSPSVHTGESLKAYKSLDAYNYYVNGWVGNITVFEVPCSIDTYVVLGRVRYSQKVSTTLLKPWLAVKMDGVILFGHCTCMAGLGEACSHIAALLFALEANTQCQKRTSCISLPCSWLPPSFQNVEYSTLADIDFMTPQAQQLNVRQQLNLSYYIRICPKQVNQLSCLLFQSIVIRIFLCVCKGSYQNH